MSLDMQAYARLPVSLPSRVRLGADDPLVAAIKAGDLDAAFSTFVEVSEALAAVEGRVSPPRAYVFCRRDPLTGASEEGLWRIEVLHPEQLFEGVDLVFLFRAAIRAVATAGEALAVAACVHALNLDVAEAERGDPKHSVLVSVEMATGYACGTAFVVPCAAHGCHYEEVRPPARELAALLSGMLAPLPRPDAFESAALTWSLLNGRAAGQA